MSALFSYTQHLAPFVTYSVYTIMGVYTISVYLLNILVNILGEELTKMRWNNFPNQKFKIQNRSAGLQMQIYHLPHHTISFSLR